MVVGAGIVVVVVGVFGAVFGLAKKGNLAKILPVSGDALEMLGKLPNVGDIAGGLGDVAKSVGKNAYDLGDDMIDDVKSGAKKMGTTAMAVGSTAVATGTKMVSTAASSAKDASGQAMSMAKDASGQAMTMAKDASGQVVTVVNNGVAVARDASAGVVANAGAAMSQSGEVLHTMANEVAAKAADGSVATAAVNSTVQYAPIPD